MHGNVWEWCADNLHDNYNGAPSDGSAWLNSDPNNNKIQYVQRGGSWFLHPWDCRSAYRDKYPKKYFVDSRGFRLACRFS